MKKGFTSLAILLSLLIVQSSSAQTVLYTQNFDSSPALPAGWYATPNSWYVDTTTGNSSSGYVGASGLHNLVIQDTTATPGNDELITSSISTIGYANIAVEWGTRLSKHFADSGSHVSLYWATDSTTWNPVTFTENPNNSNWYPDNDSTPIMLPAGAANAASLQLMWVADIDFTPSGTYRIDDLTVTGTSTTGINDISGNEFAKIFVSNNTNINITVRQPLSENLNVEIYDLTGKMIDKTVMSTQTLVIPASNYTEGIYIVKLYNGSQSMTSKVSLK